VQSTVYVTAQSVWIITLISFIVNLLNKLGKTSGMSLSIHKLRRAFVMYIVMMLVLVSLFYMLINYLCKKGYGSIAWLISAVPFIMAMVVGYKLHDVSKIMAKY
jgi:predicted neutral ceramidase superfamily lipid hydrolase